MWGSFSRASLPPPSRELIELAGEFLHATLERVERHSWRWRARGRRHRGRAHGAEDLPHPEQNRALLRGLPEDQAEELHRMNLEDAEDIEDLVELHLELARKHAVHVKAVPLPREHTLDLAKAHAGYVDDAAERLPDARRLRLAVAGRGRARRLAL